MQRKSHFDAIRVIATWMIFTFHFCVSAGLTDSWFYRYRNGGWGSVATCMFFLLSGYLLQLGGEGRALNVPDFYRKRALSIFPSQVICFIPAFLYMAYRTGNLAYGGAPWRLIFSFTGIDAYLYNYGIKTYYVIGEWFTAMILLDYLLFPLLRRLIDKWPLSTTIVLFVLYILEVALDLQPPVPADASVFTAVFLFWTGMLMSHYRDKLRLNGLNATVALAASLAVMFVRLPSFGRENFLPWKNLLGLCLFWLLNGALERVPFQRPARKCLAFFSRVSFTVYLIHHIIIVGIVSKCKGWMRVSTVRTVFIYAVILALTLTLAAALYQLKTRILQKYSRRVVFQSKI